MGKSRLFAQVDYLCVTEYEFRTAVEKPTQIPTQMASELVEMARNGIRRRMKFLQNSRVLAIIAGQISGRYWTRIAKIEV